MNRARLLAVLSLLAAGTPASAVDPPRPPVVRALAYSPDGKLLVAGIGARGQPGLVAAWEVEGRELLWQKPCPGGGSALSFAPDGKAVAVAMGKSTAVRLDAATGKELGEVGPHPVAVRAVAHIPGTDLLATGSDGIIRLWDVKTGKVAKELKDGHPAEVTSLVASPNGKWLVSTGPDATRIWDVAAGTELKGVLSQNRGIGYYGTTFVAPDRVLMSNNAAIQRITELPSGKEVLRFKNSGGYDAMAYSPAAGLAAYHWTAATEASVADLTFRKPTAEEGAKIDKILKDFDDDSYDVRVAASEAMRAIGSVAEPALRAAMTGGPSAEVRMRARETREAILNEPLRPVVGHTGAVGPMAFSPDGKVLATGAADGTIRFWDPQTAKELAKIDVPLPATKDGP